MNCSCYGDQVRFTGSAAGGLVAVYFIAVCFCVVFVVTASCLFFVAYTNID